MVVDAGEDESVLVAIGTPGPGKMNGGELLTHALCKHLDPTMY